jgi:hypothetical protein
MTLPASGHANDVGSVAIRFDFDLVHGSIVPEQVGLSESYGTSRGKHSMLADTTAGVAFEPFAEDNSLYQRGCSTFTRWRN